MHVCRVDAIAAGQTEEAAWQALPACRSCFDGHARPLAANSATLQNNQVIGGRGVGGLHFEF